MTFSEAVSTLFRRVGSVPASTSSGEGTFEHFGPGFSVSAHFLADVEDGLLEGMISCLGHTASQQAGEGGFLKWLSLAEGNMRLRLITDPRDIRTVRLARGKSYGKGDGVLIIRASSKGDPSAAKTLAELETGVFAKVFNAQREKEASEQEALETRQREVEALRKKYS